MPPEQTDTTALTSLLEENLAVAKDNNRLLREMRRNAVIGFAVKVAVYLVLLGVLPFVLSSYLGPLMGAVTGSPEGGNSLLGVPSANDLQTLLGEYKSLQESQ